MQIARVVNHIVATEKHPAYESLKILHVHVLNAKLELASETLVAIDMVDAGVGDLDGRTVVPGLIALWSLGEFAWNLQSDPADAEHLVRLTAGAWLFMGPACLHVFSELAGARRPSGRILVPISYAASAAVFMVHYTTGWGLVGMVPTPWGYGFELNFNFSVARFREESDAYGRIPNRQLIRIVTTTDIGGPCHSDHRNGLTRNQVDSTTTSSS